MREYLLTCWILLKLGKWWNSQLCLQTFRITQMSPKRSCATSVCSFKCQTQTIRHDWSYFDKTWKMMHLTTAVCHLELHWLVWGEITLQNKVTHLLLIGPDGDVLGTTWLLLLCFTNINFQRAYFSCTLWKFLIILLHGHSAANILILFINIVAQWGIRIIKLTERAWKEFDCQQCAQGRPRCKLTTRIG